MQPAKLVTFDVTGTLLLFRTPIVEVYHMTGMKFGIKADPKVLDRNFKKTWAALNAEHPNFGKLTGLGWENWWSKFVQKTFAGFIKPEEKSKIPKIVQELITYHRTKDAFTVRLGAEALLDFLKKKNVTTGVISNYDPRLHDILEQTDLKKYFDFVLISYECNYPKPDRRIFEQALTLGGCDCGHEAIHVGDDVDTDYLGSKRSGMNAALITSNLKDLEGVNECDIYKDFFELKTYFESLYGSSDSSEN